VSIGAPHSVRLTAAKPRRFEDLAADSFDTRTERHPRCLRIMARACTADTLPVLDVARTGRALMTGCTSHAVRFMIAEPPRLKERCTQFVEADSELSLSHLRVTVRTGAADTLPSLHVAGAGRTLVTRCAPNPVWLTVAEPT
jgi:hypothetical protein